MAKKVLYVGTDGQYVESAGVFEASEFVSTSAGAADAGKPVVLDAAGQIDSTMVDDSAIDHGSVSGLGDDDHTQYHTDARGDARYYGQSQFLATSAGVGSAGLPVKLDGAGHIDATMINDGDISHLNISDIGTNTHAQIDTHISDNTRHYLMLDEDNLVSNDATKAATQQSIKAYVDNSIAGLASDMTYKGIFDATTPLPDLDAQDNVVGDFYKVSIAGTFLGTQFSIGDMLVFNKNVLTGTTLTNADFDKIDNTESADLLREGDLTSGQVFVGSAGNVASGVAMTGDITISNLGVTAIGTDVVDDTMIDFGTGANQVSAIDLPIADSGSNFLATEVEGALAELAGSIQDNGISYTVGTGGITKGFLCFVSGNDTVLPYSTLGDSHRGIGLALTTEAAAGTVKVLANDTVVDGLLVGATAGTPYYWTGSALSTTLPSGSGSFVWQAGIAKNATDLHVEVRFIKKNS